LAAIAENQSDKLAFIIIKKFGKQQIRRSL
jgi:hypothetical protein